MPTLPPHQLLYDGRLHAPFFIFVRHPHNFSDADILALFKLSSYNRAMHALPLGHHAIICDVGSWTMLADDWYYTLWHMETTRPAMAAIGRCHEVYACCEGDCDRSFEFVYYRDGSLAREYAVSSPHFTDRVVERNLGKPLPGEPELLKNDGIDIGLELAERLGIRTRLAEQELRVYVPPNR